MKKSYNINRLGNWKKEKKNSYISDIYQEKKVESLMEMMNDGLMNDGLMEQQRKVREHIDHEFIDINEYMMSLVNSNIPN